MLGPERRLWSHLSDKPTILVSGARAGWRGFAFQEIKVPPEGRFDIQQAFIALSMTCGPMKVRRGDAPPCLKARQSAGIPPTRQCLGSVLTLGEGLSSTRRSSSRAWPSVIS